MCDVVERLRNACTGKVATTAWPHRLLHDAADEIEKCWENINTKADWIDATINDMAKMDQHVTALEEENKRLREALEPFAFFEPEDPEDSTQKAWETIYLDRVKDWIDYEEIAAARAALEATK